MWYLKCTYKDKSGKKHLLDRLLTTNKSYSLGRSSSNDIVIHKLSVSAVQLQFEIDAADYPHVSPLLKLKPVGKLTTINGETYDLSKVSTEERANGEYMKFTKSTSAQLGTSGITIKFIHKFVLLKLGKTMPVDKEALKTLGIIYNTALSPHTTHVVANNTDTIASLAALVQQIPIVSLDFVDALIERKEEMLNHFEDSFPDVAAYLIDKAYLPNPDRRTLFKNLLFIFGNESQYEDFKKILELAGGQTLCYQFTHSSSPPDFQNFVESHINDAIRPVLVKIQPREESFLTSIVENAEGLEVQSLRIMADASKLLGVFVITNEDLFTSVKEIDTSLLLKRRPQIVENAPLKRKRGRVKQLDSLDFFAGGSKSEQLLKENNISVIPEELQVEDSSELHEPPKKKKRSRIQKLDNELLNTEFKASESDLPIQLPESSVDVPEEEETGLQIQSSQPETTSKEREKEELESSDTLKASQKPKQSFTSTLLQAKEEANTRIKEELGLDSQFDKESVESLKDLAIVEAVHIPIREPRQAQRAKNTWDPKWEGRKNYKIFVKNTKGSKDNLFLQTRQFVNLTEFDPARDAKMARDEQMMIEELEANKESSFSFRDPAVTKKPPMIEKDSVHEGLFVSTDDDSEGEVFKFSRAGGIHNDDGLDMNSKPAEIESNSVPEFRRNTAQEPREVTKQINAINNITNIRTATPLVEVHDDDDEGDDDDDVPRFRFRS